MECNGICYDDKAVYFKVTCPGPYNKVPQKLKILKDGRASKGYKDICQEQQHYATIAYNNYQSYFEVDNAGNMIEYPLRLIAGIESKVSYDYEILSSFFDNYHITPTWINCNYIWGLFDEETGHWTGAVGKVPITYRYK